MAEDVTFVIHSEWLESIKDLPLEQQDRIIAEIVRYGAGFESQHPEDVVTQAFVNMVKGRINFSKNKYEQKVNAGKSAGRKRKVDDGEILRLAREGKSSAAIAELLGCSKSAIDHSEGWRRRKDSNITINEKTEEIESVEAFSF